MHRLHDNKNRKKRAQYQSFEAMMDTKIKNWYDQKDKGYFEDKISTHGNHDRLKLTPPEKKNGPESSDHSRQLEIDVEQTRINENLNRMSRTHEEGRTSEEAEYDEAEAFLGSLTGLYSEDESMQAEFSKVSNLLRKGRLKSQNRAIEAPSRPQWATSMAAEMIDVDCEAKDGRYWRRSWARSILGKGPPGFRRTRPTVNEEVAENIFHELGASVCTRAKDQIWCQEEQRILEMMESATYTGLLEDRIDSIASSMEKIEEMDLEAKLQMSEKARQAAELERNNLRVQLEEKELECENQATISALNDAMTDTLEELQQENDTMRVEIDQWRETVTALGNSTISLRRAAQAESDRAYDAEEHALAMSMRQSHGSHIGN